MNKVREKYHHTFDKLEFSDPNVTGPEEVLKLISSGLHDGSEMFVGSKHCFSKSVNLELLIKSKFFNVVNDYLIDNKIQVSIILQREKDDDSNNRYMLHAFLYGGSLSDFTRLESSTKSSGKILI
jgi:hypothetical protein